MSKKWLLIIIAVLSIILLGGLGAASLQSNDDISATEPASDPNDEALQAVKYVDGDWRVAQIKPTELKRSGDLQLIDSDGFWTLKRLGYFEVVFPCQDKVEAIAVQYLLPDDVSQGPDHWYKLHLNMQVKFSEQSGNGTCEITANANQRAANSVTFNSMKQDDTTLISLGSDEFSSTLVRDIALSEYIPAYFLEVNGLQSGLNTMTFLLIQRGEMKVQSLRVLDNTSIERTSATPDDSKQKTDMRKYARGLNENDATLAENIAFSDAGVQELIAGKKYQVDFTGEWDFPQVKSRTVRVDISLDKVYQIDYDWPWPPTPVSDQPNHINCWVREMTLIADMDRQVVLGIMPARHPLLIDPGDLPPELQPQGYQPSNKPVIPKLTEEERAKALQIALANDQIRQLIDGIDIAVDPETDIGVWHDGNRKIGAGVVIDLGTARWVETDWPCVEYDENNSPKDRMVHVALSVNGVSVLIDLERQKVVAIIPHEIPEEVGK